MNRFFFIFTTLLAAVTGIVCATNQQLTEEQRLQHTADSLFWQEQYPLALEHFIKALELAERNGDDVTYMHCTGFIGNIYDTFGDYKSALSYFHKGYDMAVKHKLNDMQANFLINIVMSYCRMDDAGKAKQYYELSRQTPLHHNFEYWEYYLRYNKANILRAEHKFNEAIEVHREALEYAKKHDFNGNTQKKLMFILFQESEIGNLYVKMRDVNMAKTYGYKCLALSLQAQSKELKANAYKMLADAFQMAENNDSIDKYMSLYVTVADTVYDTHSFYMAQSKLSEFEDKVRQKQIRQLWIFIALVTGGLALLGILTFFVVLNNRRLHKAQIMLVSKNKELETSDRSRQSLLDRYLYKKLEDTEFTEIQQKSNGVQLSQIQIDNLLKKIIDILNNTEHLSNPDFNLHILADLAGSNTKYVSAVINEAYGKNFKTLLNEYRCRKASQLLKDNDKYGKFDMQAVYKAVGYTNATTFIRAFKMVYGMTPSTYKKL